MDQCLLRTICETCLPLVDRLETCLLSTVEILKVSQLTNLSYQPWVRMMIVVIYTLFSVWINTKNIIRDASKYSSNISELAVRAVPLYRDDDGALN